MGKHRSRPHNPLIANTFFRTGFIEAWGRGIEKTNDSCEEAGNPMPEYTIKREDNSITARILKVIEENSMMSQKEIAETIGENPNTVKYHMRAMKKSGVIKREGSSQKGKWNVP